MISVSYEIDSLKLRYRSAGIPEDIIRVLTDEARERIEAEMENIAVLYLQQAKQAGEDVKLTKFVNELKVSKLGDRFAVGTDSGNLDFSEPPFPMLPRLLKNAKTAKDGSRYKIIPMKSRSRSVSDVRLPTATTDFRTASSKQDPNTKWVRPGKEGNMRSAVDTINEEMGEQIDNTIRAVIAEYEEIL